MEYVLISKRNQETYDINKMSLSTVLRDIGTGRLQLPNLQRSWRWPDENVVRALGSVMQGHPLGALMALETGGDVRFQNRGFDGTKAGLEDSVDPRYLMLDGQQRCTALFQACLSSRPVKIEAGKGTKYRFYFVDMHKALYEPGDYVFSIISYPVDWQGRPLDRQGDDLTNEQTQFRLKMFPLNEIYRFSDWEGRFHEYWDGDGIERESRSAAVRASRDFNSQVVSYFERYDIPVIMLRSGMGIGDVCRIYENLNTTGIPLDAFDLLIAHFAAEGHCLRTDWYGPRGGSGLKKVIEGRSHDIIADIDPKQFIQAISLVTGLREKSEKKRGMEKEDLLRLGLDDYLRSREGVVDAFEDACRFMRDWGVLPDKSMPFMLYVIAIAAIFAHLGEDRKREDVRSKLSRWLSVAILARVFESHSTRLMAENIPVVVEWLVGDGPQPSFLDRPVVAEQFIREAKAGSAYHRTIVACVLRSGAQDLVTGLGMTSEEIATVIEIPVFPNSWSKDRGLRPERYDSIVNRMMVPANRRSLFSKSVPSEYLDKCETDHGVEPENLARRLASQGIDYQTLKAEDFEQFYANRLNHLIGLVEDIIGVRVVSDAALDVIKAREAEDEAKKESADSFEPDGWKWRAEARGSRIFLDVDERGFFVMSGSVMSMDAQPSLERSYAEERQRMMADGTVTQDELGDGTWMLETDYRVGSPSQAYSIFAGQKTVGRSFRDVHGQVVYPSDYMHDDGNAACSADAGMSGEGLLPAQQYEVYDGETASRGDHDVAFGKVLSTVATALGEPLAKDGRRYAAPSGLRVKFSRTSFYKGRHDGFVKVSRKHLEDDFFVIWKTEGGKGWMVPTAKLRDFLECIPMPDRSNGVETWDPIIGSNAGRDFLWTNRELYGALDITPYAFAT